MNGRNIGPGVKALAAYWALVFLAAALLAPCPASCSVVERPLNLQDISGNASPLSVSGQVTFRCDDSSDISTNISLMTLFHRVLVTCTTPGNTASASPWTIPR
jgi:hypothetical protein